MGWPMAAAWRGTRSTRSQVVAGAVLLVFGVAFILVVSRVLSAIAIEHPVGPGSLSPDNGVLAKPPLYPPPAPLLDLPHFRYLLNADPCADGDVAGVVIVTSHAEHVELRSAHRRAYPRAELLRLGLRRVFLLARPAGMPAGPEARLAPWSRRALRDEARRFNDLVQGDFEEAYRNLTYKHTMGLLWAARYCPQALHVIKMDDDIVVDFYQLMDYVQKQPAEARTSSLSGYVLEGLRPSREPANKWFVTLEEFDGDAYPAFLSGWLYVASPAVALALAEGLERGAWRGPGGRRSLWIDDLLLTGLVRDALRPRPDLRNMNALFTVHPEVLHCCLAEPDLRCDVLVGPNGGENDLIVKFQAHAARCHFGASCRARPAHRLAERACVVRGDVGDGRLPADTAGLGQAHQVRLF